MPTPVSQPALSPTLSPVVLNQWMAKPPPADRTASFPERDLAGNVLILERRECDYPQAAKFWTKRKFDESRREEATIPGAVKGRKGPGRLKQTNENVSMQFVIDVHGYPIDGDRAQAIRAEMRSWLRGCKDLPKSWKNGTTIELRQALYLHMYKMFPELQLGNYDWKVEKIAIDVFAQLAATNRKAAKKEKFSNGAPGRKGKKRTREPSSEPESVGSVDLNNAEYLMPPERAQPEASGSTTIGPSDGALSDTIHKQDHSGPGPACADIRSTTSPSVDHFSPPFNALPVDNTPLHSNASNDTPSHVQSATISPSHSDALTKENSAHEPQSINKSTPSEAQHEGCEQTGIDTAPVKPVDIPKQVYTISNPLWTALDGAASSPPSPSPSPPPNPGPSKKVPKKTAVHVWPPTPSNTKPKPVCARIWCRDNPDGTEEMFEAFYKQLSQHHRKKYIACDGNVAVVASRKGKTQSKLVHAHLFLIATSR
uniref:Zn(2)-C6 fungal-type domain-containing protein n=1 Tax=Ganoderma boninense TaxID=34458 RepID=A0A5K1K207_9APHY|nr:Zn(2)-C6 fungal-type domain-containing protein [Ganoderma boninense]